MATSSQGMASKESQVQEQMANLASALKGLEESIDHMVERLSSVLTPMTSQGEPPQEDTIQRQLVPLAQRLADHVDYLNIQMGRLSDLTDQIEL